MKNIISFGLWGNDNKYIYGAFKNIDLADKYYPGWICRFYCHSRTIDHSITDRLIGHGAEVRVFHTALNDPKKKMTRIETAFDPEVKMFLIRDTDSRIGNREAAAVNDWILSGKLFHFMRDHKRHTAPIMGGMWGAYTVGLPDDFEQQYDKWIQDMRKGLTKNRKWDKKKCSDQGFLGNILWPYAKFEACIHDDWGRYENAKPFPMQRSNHGVFVGQQFDFNDKAIFV